jgi:predicted nucleotide-binding protein
MKKERSEAPFPPSILPTASSEEIIELLKAQKNKGQELLRKTSLSSGDVQDWKALTKEILNKAFGPNSEYISSIIYAKENKAYPVYEPESILEKERRKIFQITLERLGGYMEHLQNPTKESSKSEISPKEKSTNRHGLQSISVEAGFDEKKKESPIVNEENKTEILKKAENMESSKSEISPKEKSTNRHGLQSISVDVGFDEKKKESPIVNEENKTEILKKAENMEKSDTPKVLIIHGQDEEKKAIVASFLTKLGLEPVIPHGEPSSGINLVEKIGKSPNVTFAIILLTADDYGYPKGRPEESKPRPKQDVIFELGFLIGRIGQNLVCALCEEGLDLPPEYKGNVFIPYDPGGLWKLLIARAMKMANVHLDMNRAI